MYQNRGMVMYNNLISPRKDKNKETVMILKNLNFEIFLL